MKINFSPPDITELEINEILGIENLGVIPNHEEKEYEEPSNRIVALWRKVRG